MEYGHTVVIGQGHGHESFSITTTSKLASGAYFVIVSIVSLWPQLNTISVLTTQCSFAPYSGSMLKIDTIGWSIKPELASCETSKGATLYSTKPVAPHHIRLRYDKDI
jgi:hypothetical protein